MNLFTKSLFLLGMSVLAVGAKAQETKSFPRNVLIEEGTATWCGFCPRGIVAMKKASRQFGKRFVGIAIHYDKEMGSAGYEEGFTGGGYPSALLNRDHSIGVSSSDFFEAIRAQLPRRVPAKIEVQAEFTDASKKEIEITATAEFGKKLEGFQNYSFVVVEDSVTGFTQHNYYAGGHYGKAEGLEKLPAYYQPVYGEVARYVYPGVSGTKIAYSPHAGDIKTITKVIKTPRNIQHADKLRVVALLLGSDRVAINADKTDYLKVRVLGVQSPQTTQTMTIDVIGQTLTVGGLPEGLAYAVYRVDGQQVYSGRHTQVALTPGLYIVRCGNFTEKVIVR